MHFLFFLPRFCVDIWKINVILQADTVGLYRKRGALPCVGTKIIKKIIWQK
jgi:hypothetical protein